MLEQEREFYRQFPEAKRAHLEQWNHLSAFQDIYTESQPGFGYHEESNTLPAVSHYPEPAYVPILPVLDSSIRAAPPPYAPHHLPYDYVSFSEESSPASTTIAPSPRHAWPEQLYSMETGATPEYVVRHSYQHLELESNEHNIGTFPIRVPTTSSSY